MVTIEDDISIVLAGEAGQGLQAIESILVSLLKRSGYNVFSTSEFMSRVRGGTNSTEIRVSSKPVSGFVNRIDILMPLTPSAIDHLKKRISHDTLIIGEKEKIKYDEMKDIPFTRMAIEAGNTILTNTIAAGFICGLFKVDAGECEKFINEYFASKDSNSRNMNVVAIRKGHDAAAEMNDISISITRNEDTSGHLIMSGADSISLGALTGGCDYVCGYPMSPSTSVLEKMASYSKKFDIIVEQVEDEVGVVNMALGAWYAGARAFVTTSGGGFALMCEGISLCGMIESPLVLHLAQRPGPATGLPTRTEQGDLNLVLYAGHGDFPRIILAPGTIEEGFTLAQTAFNLADKYQVPVFILTDQFFVDSSYNTPLFETDMCTVEKYVVRTDSDYRRFAPAEGGVCTRGIPGFGTGNVCVDSDEHDEWGYITEDADVRISMVNRRRMKVEAVKRDIIPPVFSGEKEYKTLVICWGSTFNTVKEAVSAIGDKEVALLHFSWVFPLPENLTDYLSRASNLIIVENNSSAQFAQLIMVNTGIYIKNRILKYDGSPFSVEELINSLKKYL